MKVVQNGAGPAPIFVSRCCFNSVTTHVAATLTVLKARETWQRLVCEVISAAGQLLVSANQRLVASTGRVTGW